eukprot:CAMPEP_0204390920 /NCGR_PEP_ID=MMETSP0469-20131031/60981_1 /ASSEMBLY_ACC=CAM_ASM_000384 /TAXON_ID=2969 /ORGANISM="Oxyrrhis marina" /LENGTH=486 /DNA_ID=CAMNT_0051384865 /DNA_START=34 /DNA_END=1495 /DNA_ORIENTATION=+
MERYVLGKKLGQGGFGTAYVVTDENGRQFVMKRVDISKMDDHEMKNAVNEVAVLAALKHPYIVSFRESFLDQSKLCIVMTFAERGDMCARIQSVKERGETLTEPQILRWTAQVSLALKFVHDKHILHRDLKTQNLFLASGDIVKVGDFGISKVLECSQACARTTIGTPHYMSPEICQRQPYSWASDIWAFGCILYEMCALEVPFDRPSVDELLDVIKSEPAPPIPSRYSSEMIQLGQHMLEKNQWQRPMANAIIAKPLIQGEIRQMLQERDILFAFELVGGSGVKRGAVGKRTEHACKQGTASGTIVPHGKNHQESFWQEVCNPETLRYISRDQFEVQVSGAVGALIFTVVNKSSNGIHVGSSKLESKDQAKELAPDEWLVLNATTEFEVRLRFIVSHHPDVGSGEPSLRPAVRVQAPKQPGPPGLTLSSPRVNVPSSEELHLAESTADHVVARPPLPGAVEGGETRMLSTSIRGQSPSGWRLSVG